MKNITHWYFGSFGMIPAEIIFRLAQKITNCLNNSKNCRVSGPDTFAFEHQKSNLFYRQHKLNHLELSVIFVSFQLISFAHKFLHKDSILNNAKQRKYKLGVTIIKSEWIHCYVKCDLWKWSGKKCEPKMFSINWI